jgi:hypothetical protein
VVAAPAPAVVEDAPAPVVIEDAASVEEKETAVVVKEETPVVVAPVVPAPAVATAATAKNNHGISQSTQTPPPTRPIVLTSKRVVSTESTTPMKPTISIPLTTSTTPTTPPIRLLLSTPSASPLSLPTSPYMSTPQNEAQIRLHMIETFHLIHIAEKHMQQAMQNATMNSLTQELHHAEALLTNAAQQLSEEGGNNGTCNSTGTNQQIKMSQHELKKLKLIKMQSLRQIAKRIAMICNQHEQVLEQIFFNT